MIHLSMSLNLAYDNDKLLRENGFEKDFALDEKLEIHEMMHSHLFYGLPCTLCGCSVNVRAEGSHH